MFEEILKDVGKVKLANNLRLMADNQKTLNTVSAVDRDNRKYAANVRNQLAGIEQDGIKYGDEGENVDIRIDSPTSVTYLPPDKPSALSGLAKTAVVGAALLGAGGIGAVATSLLTQPTPVVPVAEPISDADTQYEMRLLPEE